MVTLEGDPYQRAAAGTGVANRRKPGGIRVRVTRRPGRCQAGVLACALCIFAFVSCAKPAPSVTIRVGVSVSIDILPYLVVRDRGFGGSLGLQLEETEYGGGAAVVEAIGRDQVDLGVNIGSVVVINAADRGLVPSVVTVVASGAVCDLQHPGMGLLVPKSITTFKQLEGQYIATNARNSLGGIMTAGRLADEGITSYTLVEIPFANQGLAVAGGNVAGATILEPYLTQSLKRGDGHLLDWLTGKPPFERIPYTMICFRTGFLQSHPEAAERYLRAHLKAVQWIGKNAREARRILGKRFGVEEDVAQAVYLPEWPQDGRNNPALLLSLESEMKGLGVIRAPVSPERLYDESYLDRAISGSR
jgi:NitT/TauT family transport system substrate-binding protein